MFVRKKSLAALAAAAAFCLALCFGLSAVSAVKASPAFRPVVVLDAGHGGIDPGVIGTDTGVRESDLNLSIVRILEELFADAGFRVVLTRTNGGGLYGLPVGGHKKRDMQARRARIEQAKPDIVLSVHQNTFPADRSRRGGQVFYRAGEAGAASLAACIQRELNGLWGGDYAPLAGDYYLLNCTPYTSVIVECGFLSNREEEALLRTDGYRRTLALAVFRGALAYFC